MRRSPGRKGPRGRLVVTYSFITDGVGSKGLSAKIWAMLTPCLCNLGLGVAHRVVTCQLSLHLGLVPIYHECTTGRRGAWAIIASQSEGFVGHECYVVHGAHRL